MPIIKQSIRHTNRVLSTCNELVGNVRDAEIHLMEIPQSASESSASKTRPVQRPETANDSGDGRGRRFYPPRCCFLASWLCVSRGSASGSPVSLIFFLSLSLSRTCYLS